ncbi:unnamed protein product, partial [Meganyctiphanes norvegica]
VAEAMGTQYLKRKQNELLPFMLTDNGNLQLLDGNYHLDQMSLKDNITTAKKIRRAYTEEEQKVLRTHYNNNNFPLPADISLIARRIRVRDKQVMHWFQNKRRKERKKIEGKQRCNICQTTFVSDSNLEIHKEEYHKSEGTENNKLSCSLLNCQATFTNAELLATHKVSHELRDEIEDHKIDDYDDEEDQDDV